MTPDTTTTREYQVRWPDGLVADAWSLEHARGTIKGSPSYPGAKIYTRTVTSTCSAWAEVVEAKEAQHG